MGNGCNAVTSRPGELAGRSLTLSERLYQRKKDLMERLDLINNAIEALEKVPDFQMALDAVSKVGLY